MLVVDIELEREWSDGGGLLKVLAGGGNRFVRMRQELTVQWAIADTLSEDVYNKVYEDIKEDIQKSDNADSLEPTFWF